MAEAVVILPPDVRGQQIVERGDRPAPRDVVAHLEPLGVLVEHRVDDVDERLVAGEEAVPAGEQIALEPALALVLAEHLHDPAVRSEVIVLRLRLRHPRAVGHLEHVLPAIRVALVGAEEAEVAGSSRLSFITSRRNLPMTRVDSAVVAPGLTARRPRSRGNPAGAGPCRSDTAVGVRVGAHAAAAPWAQARPARA